MAGIRELIKKIAEYLVEEGGGERLRRQDPKEAAEKEGTSIRTNEQRKREDEVEIKNDAEHLVISNAAVPAPAPRDRHPWFGAEQLLRK